MSTRWDVLDAKQAYNLHMQVHKCSLLHDKCAIRLELLQAWYAGPNSAAGRLGMDEYPETHKQRSERQFRERVSTGSSTS